MLSVLIYPKSSQEFLDRYSRLFEPYTESGRVALCFWDEHGTDIASALPKLEEIVGGVRKWKAIVVMPVTEQEQDAVRPDNPFDYLCNSEPEPVVHESPVPLIRLAQMLGGVPLVNRHFDSVMERHTPECSDDGEELSPAERRRRTTELLTVRRREQDQELLEQQKRWQALTDQYSFRCDRPSELYLFRGRNPALVSIPELTDRESMRRREHDSSLFWYRNRYPARARFILQDCARVGNAHYHEELFQFWMTAFTLALNHQPPGTFEAYKVYQARAHVDFDQMHQRISDYYNRLGGARFAAQKQITELQKASEFTREQESLPNYRGEVKVRFDPMEEEEFLISSSGIGLAGNCPQPEVPWWKKAVQDSLRSMEKLFHSIRRSLDRSSTRCRLYAKVTEEELFGLDEYQVEEMNEQLSELEQRILTFHVSALLPLNKYRKDLKTGAHAAQVSMEKRMTRRTTAVAGAVMLGIYAMGFLPDLVYQLLEGEGLPELLGLTALGMALLSGVLFLCLLWFRSGIRAKIGDYNAIQRGILADYQKAGGTFSGYLSDCCSYMRGRYILLALKRRTTISAEGIAMLSRHVEQLDQHLSVIEGWLQDFSMRVLPDSGALRSDNFNFDIPPEKNRDYLFQLDAYPLEVPGVGGSVCTAPYPFITHFSVERVRLYEKPAERGVRQP